MPKINFSKFTDLLKKLTDFIPKKGIEKLLFKALLGIWVLVIIAVIVLRIAYTTYNNVEDRIKEAATSARPPVASPSEITMYESLLDMAKYPEGIEEYSLAVRRDPFSEHREILPPVFEPEHDFVLKSIERIPLPLMYKGFIELPDRIIGQINLEGTTRFVEVGSRLDSYRILNISREKIIAMDASDKKLEFLLNEPIFSDKLSAVLYDNISEKEFNVDVGTKIEDYKVIEIMPDYVVLQYKNEEKEIHF